MRLPPLFELRILRSVSHQMCIRDSRIYFVSRRGGKIDEKDVKNPFICDSAGVFSVSTDSDFIESGADCGGGGGAAAFFCRKFALPLSLIHI